MSFKSATQPQINKIKVMVSHLYKWEDNEFYHDVQGMNENSLDKSAASEIIGLLKNKPEEAKKRLKLILSKPKE